jgi:hypothetical protein
MDPGEKRGACRLFYQLVSGSKEEKQLADVMAELDRAKSDLSLCLQVYLVGLQKTSEESFITDNELVELVSGSLEKVLDLRWPY